VAVSQRSWGSEMMSELRKLWGWPLSGTIELRNGTCPMTLVSHLFGVLRCVEACETTLDGNRITFTCGSYLEARRWSMLAAYSAGEVEIDVANRQVRYRLRMARMAVVIALVQCFMWTLGIVLLSTSWVLMVPFVALGWFFFVGGNLLTGACRFWYLLHRSVLSVPEQRG